MCVTVCLHAYILFLVGGVSIHVQEGRSFLWGLPGLGSIAWDLLAALLQGHVRNCLSADSACTPPVPYWVGVIILGSGASAVMGLESTCTCMWLRCLAQRGPVVLIIEECQIVAHHLKLYCYEFKGPKQSRSQALIRDRHNMLLILHIMLCSDSHSHMLENYATSITHE